MNTGETQFQVDLEVEKNLFQDFESPRFDNQHTYILKKEDAEIVDVWQSNFVEELDKISTLVKKYNVIAMDTEFPGVTHYPPQNIDDNEYEYALVRENVNRLKIIQIGISLSDEEGNVPDGISTWQFNFKFDLENDQIKEDSRNILENAGIDFNRFKQEGIDSEVFAEEFIGSGIACNDCITWIAFHGGFDFGYFLQMLYGTKLPDKSDKFQEQLVVFFPQIYDIKYVIKDSQLKDLGLQKLSQELKVKRIGPQHQAGSDSLLTLGTYFKLRKDHFESNQHIFENGVNMIYNIGSGYVGEKKKGYIQQYKNLSNDNISYSNMDMMGFQYQNYMAADESMQQYYQQQMGNFGGYPQQYPNQFPMMQPQQHMYYSNMMMNQQYMEDQSVYQQQKGMGNKRNYK